MRQSYFLPANSVDTLTVFGTFDETKTRESWCQVNVIYKREMFVNMNNDLRGSHEFTGRLRDG